MYMMMEYYRIKANGDLRFTYEIRYKPEKMA